MNSQKKDIDKEKREKKVKFLSALLEVVNNVLVLLKIKPLIKTSKSINSGNKVAKLTKNTANISEISPSKEAPVAVNKKINKEITLKKIVKKDDKRQPAASVESSHVTKLSDNGLHKLDQVSSELNKYEIFIKKDLLHIISQANALLQAWRSNIAKINKLDLSLDLQNIFELYHDSESQVSDLVNNCHQYGEIVGNIKQQVPISKITNIERQLNRVRGNLEKGQAMLDVNNNKNYQYLLIQTRAKNASSRAI